MSYSIPVDLITYGLKDFDMSHFEPFKNQQKYNTNMVKSVANKLGKNLSTYDNMIAAGRLLLLDSVFVCGDATNYATLMSHRLSKDVHDFIIQNADEIDVDAKENAYDDYHRHNLFSALTLIKTYLMTPGVDEDPYETPQQLYLRVAIQTYMKEGIKRVLEVKNQMSKGYYTVASPTLFNAGTTKPQMSSCFLVNIGDDLKSILETGVYHCGLISSGNGGIGLNLSNLRHSQIGYVGKSSGVIPAARVYDKLVKYVDQGGKRDGAATAFLKLTHIDVVEFIKATDNYSDHSQRFQTMNTCLWTSRLFFEKVAKDEAWFIFCPAKTKLLNTTYGVKYEEVYENTVKEALRRDKIFIDLKSELLILKNERLSNPTNKELQKAYGLKMKETVDAGKNRIEHKMFKNASDLLKLIVENQVKASTPYIMHGDACNYKNNQKHRGPIDQSNLCVSGDTEILTTNGYVRIDSVIGQEVEIWNGTQWSKVTPFQTSDEKPLYKVVLKSGLSLTCTSDHKFLVDDEKNKNIDTVSRVKCKDLKIGDIMLNFELPHIENNKYNHIENDEVIDIIDTQTVGPTYCFAETKNYAGIFNGILTGQCLEIIEHNTPESIASCNLGSYNLPRYVTGEVDHSLDFKSEVVKYFDFQMFGKMCREMVEALDKRIDMNYYPLNEYSKDGTLLKKGNIHLLNEEMRPLGIGVSGLDDCFKKLDIPHMSPEAEYCNKIIFACKYFNELCESIRLASLLGAYPGMKTGAYEKYCGNGEFKEMQGAPFSHGTLQFDLWQEEAQLFEDQGKLYSLYDRNDDIPLEPSTWGQKDFTFIDKEGKEYTIKPTWQSIKDAIAIYGIRNSMLGAIMPTASTANIFSNAESTEPYQANVFCRNVNKGNFLIVVSHLENDLKRIGCWSEKLIKFVIIDNGSVRYIIHYIEDHPETFPEAFTSEGKLKPEVRNRLEFLLLKYKTVFEISQKWLIKLCRQRGIYIDQSQSFNIHLSDPKTDVLMALHTMTCLMGLKTGQYYLRMSPSKFIGKFDADVEETMYYEELLSKLGAPKPKPNAPKDEPQVCELRSSDLADGSTCVVCQ